MSDMRLAVCSRRSVIKGVGRPLLSVFHTLSENIIFTPELFNFLFTIHKIQIRRNFLIHDFLPFLCNRSFPGNQGKKKPSCKRTGCCHVYHLLHHTHRVYGFICFPITEDPARLTFRICFPISVCSSEVIFPVLLPSTGSHPFRLAVTFR